MSFYVDLKYLKFVSSRIQGFTKKSDVLWNCRCHICGDSLKNEHKKRGYFFRHKDSLIYKCFNCDISLSLYSYLNYIDGSLAKEYLIENFKSNIDQKPKNETLKFSHTPPKFKSSVVINLPNINDLNIEHEAKQYVIHRQIPDKYHKSLFYSNNFKDFISLIKPELDKNLPDNDPRIVIPFFDEDNNLFAVQGRSLKSNSIRYITIKLNDEKTKLFGLNDLNINQQIFVVESPIDSMFLSNCIATADGNLETAVQYLNKKTPILIPDKEPRNKHICNYIERYIEHGLNVCLLPHSLPGKDINEFVLNGIKKSDLEQIILKNTFNGLRAKLEFMKWRLS